MKCCAGWQAGKDGEHRSGELHRVSAEARAEAIMAGGAYCTGGQWVNRPDRNAKDNFAPVDSRGILEKLAALPVTTWNYKTETRSVKHLGPTAQDFHAAFALGDSDTAIGTVDETGVALTAIQGLNQKVEVRSQKAEAGIKELQAENAELKRQLRDLRQMVLHLSAAMAAGDPVNDSYRE